MEVDGKSGKKPWRQKRKRLGGGSSFQSGCRTQQLDYPKYIVFSQWHWPLYVTLMNQFIHPSIQQLVREPFLHCRHCARDQWRKHKWEEFNWWWMSRVCHMKHHCATGFPQPHEVYNGWRRRLGNFGNSHGFHCVHSYAKASTQFWSVLEDSLPFFHGREESELQFCGSQELCGVLKISAKSSQLKYIGTSKSGPSLFLLLPT